MKNLLKGIIQDRLDEKQDIGKYYYGVMGSGSTVGVPGKPGYVYVTLEGGSVAQAYNAVCPNNLNYPVVVGYDPTQTGKIQLSVLSARIVPRVGMTEENDITVRQHHASHEWMNASGGRDVVFVQTRQLMPLRPTPLGNWYLYINPDMQLINSSWQLVGGQVYYLGARAINSYTCGSAGDEHLMLVSLNMTSGSIVFTNGTLKAIGTSTMADIPATPANNVPICAIHLWTGQTDVREAITQTDLTDLRMLKTIVSDHNSLSGLQGGSAGERYHLTVAEREIALQQYSGSAPILVSGSVITHDASGVTPGTYNRLEIDMLGHVTSGSDVPDADVTYSGSAPISISGSVISHDASGVTPGTYGQVEVDALGHVIDGTTGSAGVYSGSAPISVSDSVISHNASGVIPGAYNRLEIDILGHVTSGSDVPGIGITYSGSAPISISGSVIAHDASGVTPGTYSQVDVDGLGHITSGSSTVAGHIIYDENYSPLPERPGLYFLGSGVNTIDKPIMGGAYRTYVTIPGDGVLPTANDGSIAADLVAWNKFIPMLNESVSSGNLFTTTIMSTYALAYTAASVYTGGVLAPNGDIHFVPYAAAVGQKISAAGVVSTYTLAYTTAGGAHNGGVLAPNGDVHFVPAAATVGQKVSAAGVVSTYALVYAVVGAYYGGVLAPNGDVHFVPYNAAVGQKVSAAGVVSTYALAYTIAVAYAGGVLAPNGDVHFVPRNAIVGQKVSAAGVVSTYALAYTIVNAYIGGVLAPNGDVHFVPLSAIVGQKVSAAGVVSTYALAYTIVNAHIGGVLAPNGDIHFAPFAATVGQRILNVAVKPFSIGVCCSPFFNKS